MLVQEEAQKLIRLVELIGNPDAIQVPQSVLDLKEHVTDAIRLLTINPESAGVRLHAAWTVYMSMAQQEPMTAESRRIAKAIMDVGMLASNPDQVVKLQLTQYHTDEQLRLVATDFQMGDRFSRVPALPAVRQR